MLPRHRFSKEIKDQIKKLYLYDNYHGPFALLQNLFWISLAIYLGESSPWLLPLAILFYPYTRTITGGREQPGVADAEPTEMTA